ncbi:MAG: DEAD/DEAH box helicase [Saprospiraceae bacterium]
MTENQTTNSGFQNKTKWHLKNDGIYYHLKNEFVPVKASEIIKIEHKGLNEILGEQFDLKPSEVFPNIQFKRFPGTILLKLLLPGTIQKKPYLQLCLKLQNREFLLDNLPVRDQIILGTDWIPLYEEEVKEILEFALKFNYKVPGYITLKKAIDLIKSNNDLVVVINGEDMLREDSDNLNIHTDQDLLSDIEFNATLYPYQKRGVQWMKNLFDEELGFILADEMGLGKTIQIIALITIARKLFKAPALIIAPATLLENWRREIAKFSPSLTCFIHAGQNRTGFPFELEKYDVIITSYDIVVSDQSMMKMILWSFVILDEAQAIKNPDTQRAKAVKSLNRKISIAVSGTPFENRLLDIWSLFDFICQGMLGKRNNFEKEFCTNEENASRIEQIISPLILRRRVIDVAKDLPEKIVIPEAILMNSIQIDKYENIRTETQKQYGTQATLVSLIKLRQFCTHPDLLNKSIPNNPLEESGKYQRLTELLTEILNNGFKSIIFTSYTLMTDILIFDLSRRFLVPTMNIDGRTPIPERQQIVDDFSSVNGPAVLILNPKAAGTGLNITAANYVIHYNPEWNPATEDQATARSYRRGQKLPVFVYRLFYSNTVEEVMQDRMERKRDLSHLAIVGTNASEIDSSDIARALSLSPVYAKRKNI